MTELSMFDDYLGESERQELYFECLIREDSPSPLTAELFYNVQRPSSENYLNLSIEMDSEEIQEEEVPESSKEPLVRIHRQFQPLKKIGMLSAEERYAKVEKYLLKRQRRNWNRKISYGCRKKVAENRVRVKGRFVTKEQANVIKEDI